MKILVVSNLFPPHTVGGYEVACEAFLQRFAGDEVTILTTHYGLAGPAVSGNVARVLPNVFGTWPHGPLALPRGTRRFFTPEVFSSTRDWIRRTQPDVCYLWNLMGLSLAPVVASRASSIPVAYHFEDNWLPDLSFHPRRAVQWTKQRIGAPFAFTGKTGAIFVSDFLRRSYCAQGFSFGRNTVIYNGVGPQPLSHQIHRDRSSSEPPLRVLFVGRVVPEKGVDTLIEAVRLVQQVAPGSVSLSIAGFGPDAYVEELKRRAATGGLDVRWLGRLDRAGTQSAYGAHDVAVVPSSWEEPFGLVAVEAMAAGLPVVATRSGGLAEIVRPERNGLLVPRNDAVALRDALMRLVNEPDLRLRLGDEAERDARERFDIDVQARLARQFLDLMAGS